MSLPPSHRETIFSIYLERRYYPTGWVEDSGLIVHDQEYEITQHDFNRIRVNLHWLRVSPNAFKLRQRHERLDEQKASEWQDPRKKAFELVNKYLL
jgi:hypothetical protein